MVKYGVVGAGYFGAELARYMQKNSLIKELSETFYIVIQLVMVGKNNNRQYHGKKFVKNQVVTCITTSMNWIAFNSLWGACLKL
ncbi:hypothetical protein ASP0581_16270 [Streptococcus pneumoniae]|nr:hypothetical protein ASP0581_16270 [Streptococcus pneumoniae]